MKSLNQFSQSGIDTLLLPCLSDQEKQESMANIREYMSTVFKVQKQDLDILLKENLNFLKETKLNMIEDLESGFPDLLDEKLSVVFNQSKPAPEMQKAAESTAKIVRNSIAKFHESYQESKKKGVSVSGTKSHPKTPAQSAHPKVSPRNQTAEQIACREIKKIRSIRKLDTPKFTATRKEMTPGKSAKSCMTKMGAEAMNKPQKLQKPDWKN